MRKPSIKALVFDVYGTLLNPVSIETTARDIITEGLSFVMLWRSKQLEYSWLLSLMGQYRSFWEITEMALDFVCARTGHELDSFRRRQLLDSWAQVAPYPDVLDGLEQLKTNGFRLAVLSNGSPEMLEKGLANSGVLPFLEKVMSVEEVRIFKPSPRVYKLALDWLGTENPAEIGFISSNCWDVIGAATFGFNACWLNRANLSPDTYSLKPIHNVTSFNEAIANFREL
jgi:2-haloacid dehalogenase